MVSHVLWRSHILSRQPYPNSRVKKGKRVEGIPKGVVKGVRCRLWRRPKTGTQSGGSTWRKSHTKNLQGKLIRRVKVSNLQ